MNKESDDALLAKMDTLKTNIIRESRIEILAEDLKHALDQTYRIAVGIEIVNKSLNPYSEIGMVGKRRLERIKQSAF